MSDFDELNEQADKGELTPEKLQDRLNSYHEAFRQEFESQIKSDPENVEEYTQDFFKKNVHSAAAQIVWLSNNADNESVKLNAAKYVVEQALRDANKDGDPIKDVLKELTAKKKQSTANTAN